MNLVATIIFSVLLLYGLYCILNDLFIRLILGKEKGLLLLISESDDDDENFVRRYAAKRALRHGLCDGIGLRVGENERIVSDGYGMKIYICTEITGENDRTETREQ